MMFSKDRLLIMNLHNAILHRKTFLSSYVHRRRRRREGGGGSCPPNSGKTIFSGKNRVKFEHFVNFSGIYHVKFANFINFTGKYHVKFWHFVNFSCIHFRANMSPPPKLTELLSLCICCTHFITEFVDRNNYQQKNWDATKADRTVESEH